MFIKRKYLLFGLFIIFSSFLFLSKPANAQFSGDLGAISGSVRWGTQDILPPEVSIDVQGASAGYHTVLTNPDFNTGFNLPPDTYTVVASMKDGASNSYFVMGSQSVVVASGQVTNVNFDASAVSGLVKGDLRINGILSTGMVQFCSPVVTDPCPIGFTSSNGPFYTFNASGFSIPMSPGDYRVHVKTVDHVNIGIKPVTVVVGEIVNMSFGTPIITTTFLPAGTVGGTYNQNLSLTNGISPYSWSIILGSMPDGLNLSSTGTISGTPTVVGSFDFTVQVADANLQTDTQDLTIVVNSSPTIDTTTLKDATVSTNYSELLATSGGTNPICWTVLSRSEEHTSELQSH